MRQSGRPPFLSVSLHPPRGTFFPVAPGSRSEDDPMANGSSRPLSPHLQIYRFQWTMALSITHRITGVGLVLGTLLLTWWLVAAATGPDAFARAQKFVGSGLGLLLLFGWTWALFLHLGNGIRHLVWDAGHGFELKCAEMGAYVVAGASLALTVLVWIVGLAVW